MATELERRVELLKQSPLVAELSDEDIAQIAKRMVEERLPANELVFSQGDVPDKFYIVIAGRVKFWREEQEKNIDSGILEQGDHFGEEGLLYKQCRNAFVQTLEPTTLFYLDEQDFNWMVQSCTKVKSFLSAIAETHRRAEQLKFDWLLDGEVIYMIKRRHIIHFIQQLVMPISISAILALFSFLSANTDSNVISLFSKILIAFLVIAFLWILWIYLDWRNDYFIVTSQRVVWLEHELLTSDSRQEPPITAIQSVKVDTEFWGRMFKYGDVTVKTFTGQTKMTKVDRPDKMKELIERLIKRERSKTEKAKLDALRSKIRTMLDPAENENEDTQEIPAKVTIEQKQERQKNSSRPFGMRVIDEKGNITYHKHWFVLFKKLFIPTLSIIAALVGVILSFFMPGTTKLAIVALVVPFIFVIALWWLYQYQDWSNDIYRLTEDTIIDREKRPLGKEESQTAPLKNVLSVEHERKNIVHILLNLGTVKINVGDSTLEFYDLYNPAQVHQDIFDYKQALELRGEQKEMQREHERISTWFNIYHEETGDSRSMDHEPDFN